jgi:hypothetical protein
MENPEHNLSNFLIKSAYLLEPSGCRTVEELLASQTLPTDLSEAAKGLLADLRTLDYVALRSLVAAIIDPWVYLDDESLLP